MCVQCGLLRRKPSVAILRIVIMLNFRTFGIRPHSMGLLQFQKALGCGDHRSSKWKVFDMIVLYSCRVKLPSIGHAGGVRLATCCTPVLYGHKIPQECPNIVIDGLSYMCIVQAYITLLSSMNWKQYFVYEFGSRTD